MGSALDRHCISRADADFGFLTSASHFVPSSDFHGPLFCILMSPSDHTRSIGFHVLVCGTFSARFVLHLPNCPIGSALQVGGVGVSREAPYF